MRPIYPTSDRHAFALHDQNVAFTAHEGEGGLQFGPVALSAGGFLDKDALAACLSEGIELELGVLVLG
jgi:hypothetical protein